MTMTEIKHCKEKAQYCKSKIKIICSIYFYFYFLFLLLACELFYFKAQIQSFKLQ